MPFTPSHAALVLPFVRIDPRYVSATGLIIGSLAPDFEYFFRMSPTSEYSHTLAGMFYFDLPVTLVLALVFHLVVKQRLIGNLPVFLQSRLQPLLQLDFMPYLKANAPAFAVSAVVGAASHIFWDAFTHGDGFFVEHMRIYDNRVVPFEGVRYPLWYALQNISSWVGLFVIIVYVLRLKPGPGIAHTPALWPALGYWCFVLIVTALVVGLRFHFDLTDVNIGIRLIVLISGLCVALVLASFIPFRAASGYR
jgi:hypothetical protein